MIIYRFQNRNQGLPSENFLLLPAAALHLKISRPMQPATIFNKSRVGWNGASTIFGRKIQDASVSTLLRYQVAQEQGLKFQHISSANIISKMFSTSSLGMLG